MKTKLTALTSVLILLSFCTVPSAHAEGYFRKHPYQQKALIGGGVGAVAGGLIGGKHHRGSGAIKGAVIGGAAGTGYEYLKRR